MLRRICALSRETFHLPDDLTEEEKLEPVKNATADPRIRLLNRLYAKKRKVGQQHNYSTSLATLVPGYMYAYWLMLPRKEHDNAAVSVLHTQMVTLK